MPRTFNDEPDEEVWAKWRSLVNMTRSELIRFMGSADGRVAGLSAADAKRMNIKPGRESALWLLRMMPHGTSFKRAVDNWTPAMWQWARRQNSFNSRMRHGRGSLYTKDGSRSRRHLSLLIWGHNPEKPLRRV